MSGRFEISEINYRDIGLLETREYNKIAKQALARAGIGMAIGVFSAISSSSGTDPGFGRAVDFSPSPAGSVILSSALGAGTGVALGLVKIKIPINGNFENYKRHRDKFKSMSFQ